MQRTNGSLAHRARPLFVAATLVVALGLAFMPIGPAPVIAVTPDPAASVAPSIDPGLSPAPDSTPIASPDPTPTPTPDSTPIASPDPTPTPTPSDSPPPSPLPPGVVGPDGGTVSSANATLYFPSGAVGAPTRISIWPVGALPELDGLPPVGGLQLAAVDEATGGAVLGFGMPVSVSVSTDVFDLVGIDPATLRLAVLSGANWTVLPTDLSSGVLSASVDAPGTIGVVEHSSSAPVRVTVLQSSDAPAAGRHRVDPGSSVKVTVIATPATRLTAGRLVSTVPGGWTITDPGGGVIDATANTITWGLARIRGGVRVARTIAVTAPTVPAADGSVVLPFTFSAGLEQAGGVASAPDLGILVAPVLAVEHVTQAQVDPETLAVTTLPVDAAITNEQRFEVLRLRFKVRNSDDVAVSWTPRLEYRMAGGTDFHLVPSGENVAGMPFHAAREWVPAQGPSGGTKLGPAGETIAAVSLLGDDRDLSGETPVAGEHAMGVNPAPRMGLAARSYTVVEFSIRATVDAPYLSGFDFRVTDDGAPLPGARVASLQMGPMPEVQLTPGQVRGIPASGIYPAVQGVAYRLIPGSGIADAPGTSTARLAVAQVAVGAPRYALLAMAMPSATAGSLAPASGGPFVSPHGSDAMNAGSCDFCHRTHSASGPNLMPYPLAQSNLCFACHDGSGATSNVAANYTKTDRDGILVVPANDPTTSSYYRHDALNLPNPSVGQTHTQADTNEFQTGSGTPILNRHSECGDCHDAHRATATDSTMTTAPSAGWTASGRLVGMSGVTVTNGVAASSPTYAWTPSDAATPLTLEYQVCFKCHSGFTTLLPQTFGKPSTWSLDKGIELNPNNASYHPVEAAGTNQTSAMTSSLLGTSPYKLWIFSTTDTVRCVNCHGDPSKFNVSSPPAADSDLSPHASQNRGILLQNYRDRTLKSAFEDYAAADFALCYVCHAEAPFVDATGNVQSETNFRYHGLHVSALQNRGSGGTSIDASGDGRGDAVCAECHFRIHGTAIAVKPGDANNSRLVNFAPNVDTTGGGWSSTGEGSGTCALTCHGYAHGTRAYGTVPLLMTLAVTTDTASFSAAGDSITFTYAVTNAGSSTLVGPITITDDHVLGTDGIIGHAFVCSSGDLAASGKVTCTGTYTTVGSDVTAGSVLTTATAHAGAADSNTARVTVRLSP